MFRQSSLLDRSLAQVHAALLSSVNILKLVSNGFQVTTRDDIGALIELVAFYCDYKGSLI